MEIGALQLRPVVGGELDNARIGLEQVPRPVDLTAHERLRAALDGADHPVITAAGHRIDAEEHTPEAGIDQRLHEHADRVIGGAGAST